MGGGHLEGVRHLLSMSTSGAAHRVQCKCPEAARIINKTDDRRRALFTTVYVKLLTGYWLP